MNTISSPIAGSVNKPNIIKKLVAPLVMGSALVLGGKADASLNTTYPLEKIELTEPVTQDKKESSGDYTLGYVSGALAGHLLQHLLDKKKVSELQEENERLKKVNKIVK